MGAFQGGRASAGHVQSGELLKVGFRQRHLDVIAKIHRHGKENKLVAVDSRKSSFSILILERIEEWIILAAPVIWDISSGVCRENIRHFLICHGYGLLLFRHEAIRDSVVICTEFQAPAPFEIQSGHVVAVGDGFCPVEWGFDDFINSPL